MRISNIFFFLFALFLLIAGLAIAFPQVLNVIFSSKLVTWIFVLLGVATILYGLDKNNLFIVLIGIVLIGLGGLSYIQALLATLHQYMSLLALGVGILLLFAREQLPKKYSAITFIVAILLILFALLGNIAILTNKVIMLILAASLVMYAFTAVKDERIAWVLVIISVVIVLVVLLQGVIF